VAPGVTAFKCPTLLKHLVGVKSCVLAAGATSHAATPVAIPSNMHPAINKLHGKRLDGTEIPQRVTRRLAFIEISRDESIRSHHLFDQGVFQPGDENHLKFQLTRFS
jgi:hypothetical protein